MTAELEAQLAAFAREHVGAEASVRNVAAAPGHAGFNFFFDVEHRGAVQRYILRLPPPGVRYVGTADVLRQARVMRALEDTAVPVPHIVWAGEDERWFGRPYFVAERLAGDTLRAEDNPVLTRDDLRAMTREAVEALAALHALDWTEKVPDDGPPLELEPDVHRWDRFAERAAEPQMMALQPAVKELLLRHMPAGPPVGIFHGDCQWTNFLYGPDKHLAAFVDWELWGVGATLNDLGWLCTFADDEAWATESPMRLPTPPPDDIIAWYTDARGAAPRDIEWYRALGAYKFAIITGLNLDLHRRGKRHDPHWEELKPAAHSLLQRAHDLLAGA